MKRLGKGLGKTWKRFGKRLGLFWKKHKKVLEKDLKGLKRLGRRLGKTWKRTWKKLEKTWKNALPNTLKLPIPIAFMYDNCWLPINRLIKIN